MGVVFSFIMECMEFGTVFGVFSVVVRGGVVKELPPVGATATFPVSSQSLQR